MAKAGNNPKKSAFRVSSEPESGMDISERVMLAQKHSQLELAKEVVKDY